MELLSPFQLPNELLIASLCAQYPCREQQIRSLATLLSVRCLIYRPFHLPKTLSVLHLGSHSLVFTIANELRKTALRQITQKHSSLRARSNRQDLYFNFSPLGIPIHKLSRR